MRNLWNHIAIFFPNFRALWVRDVMKYLNYLRNFSPLCNLHINEVKTCIYFAQKFQFYFHIILFCFEKEKKNSHKNNNRLPLENEMFLFFLSNHKIKPLKRRMDSDFVSGLSTIIFSQKRFFTNYFLHQTFWK